MSGFLVTILGTAYSQTAIPPKPVPPFSASFNEANSNRLFAVLQAVRSAIPKSKVPMDDGISILNNTDTLINLMQAQYVEWAKAQRDTTKIKKP